MEVENGQFAALTAAVDGAATLSDEVGQLHQDAKRLAKKLVELDELEDHDALSGVRTDGLNRVPDSLAGDPRDRVNGLLKASRRLVESANAAGERDRSASVGVPADVTLPLFVYGCFKPGELAWPLIENHAADVAEGRLDGYGIRRRDGLPLLQLQHENLHAEGYLLHARTDRQHQLYRTVGQFEPGNQYQWDTVEVPSGYPANVLLGAKPDLASEHDVFSTWSAADDPVFCDGIPTVRRLTRSRDLFIREAAFLLLWSITERYTALRLGPHRSAEHRIDELDHLPQFKDAVQATLRHRVDPVHDSRTLAPHEIEDDGTGAARYWYTIRCNLSHRGKGDSGSDEIRLGQSLEGLLAVMKKLLGDQFPALAEYWHTLTSPRPLPGRPRQR